MAIVKLLLVFTAVLAQFYAATPPNVRPPTEQLRDQSPLERLLPRLSWLSKIVACTWATFELALVTRDFLPTSADPSTPTLALLAGTLFILAGTLLRALCFYTLGTSFTFELAIRPEHVLVTGGVYAFVRHPSYTGIHLLVAGWLLCLTDAVGAFTRGEEAAVIAATVCVWVTQMGTCYVLLSRRMDKEDRMLEGNFGEEWRVWAKRVPYRLIPGVC